MSVAVNVNKITLQTALLTPAVMAAIQAVQGVKDENGVDLSGATKQQIVVSQFVGGIEAGSAALENHPNPNVASIAILVNLLVGIFHATGKFQKKAPPAVPAA